MIKKDIDNKKAILTFEEKKELKDMIKKNNEKNSEKTITGFIKMQFDPRMFAICMILNFTELELTYRSGNKYNKMISDMIYSIEDLILFEEEEDNEK